VTFKEYLTEIQKGPVAGAFGKWGKVGRQDNRFQSYSDRVNYGKGIEGQIYKNLEGCGFKLRKPTTAEDKYSKIDGWWNDGTQEHPLQIKYRDSGDDLLFEVMKDYYGNIPGRDMVGQATHYAVLSKDGKIIRVVLVADAKKIINQMVQGVESKGWPKDKTYRMPVEGGLAMLRIRPDPSTGVEKLMAYIPPSALKSVKECPATVKFA